MQSILKLLQQCVGQMLGWELAPGFPGCLDFQGDAQYTLGIFHLHERPLPEICKVSVNILQVDPGKTLFGPKTINFQAPKWPKKRFIDTYLGMCLGQSDN